MDAVQNSISTHNDLVWLMLSTVYCRDTERVNVFSGLLSGLKIEYCAYKEVGYSRSHAAAAVAAAAQYRYVPVLRE